MAQSGKYLVTFKENTSPAIIEQCKQSILSQGGAIGHEFELTGGFAATIPDGHIGTKYH